MFPDKKELVRVSCYISLFRIIPIDQMFNYWLMDTLFTLNERVPSILEHVTNSPRDFAENERHLP